MVSIQPEQERKTATKGDKAKVAILTAATRRFAQMGYQETSVQSIADATGICQSTVLYHFSTKRDLYAAVIASIVKQNESIAEAVANPHDNASERLKKHFEINYRWAVESDFNAQLMTGLFHFASYDPAFASIYSKILIDARKKIHALILSGVREKVFSLSIDAELASEVLHDGLLGIILTLLTANKRPDAKAHSRLKWQILTHCIVGDAPFC
jgi:AcrR family transcriptional regulator